MMENIIDSVIAAYVRRSGQSAEKIMEMMEATTWLFALEAQSMGFCDVITEEVALEMSANSIELLSRFPNRSEEHTSELQSLMRISYAVFCLKKKNTHTQLLE